MSDTTFRARLYRLAETFHKVPTLVRIPLGFLLICGSLLFFLPVFGVWMAPFGLLLLAEDFEWAHTAFEWTVSKFEAIESYFTRKHSSENHEND